MFVVPDGTGIRNYLFSKIIPALENENAEVLIYHALSNEAISEVEKLHNVKLIQKRILKYKERFKQKLFREVICYSRLIYNSNLENNDTIITNWKSNHSGIKKWFYKVVEIIGKNISSDYEKILAFEKQYQKSLEISIQAEKEFLKSYKPDIIFCTHQRALNVIPVFKAAEALKIKTIGAIYSWDNVVKARLSVRTNKYIVWSNHMKQEMIKYYPEIKGENIYVTGTPQFELYDDIELDSKEDFFKTYNLNIEKFTVCFSGDDELTSPNDPEYLKDLAETIIAGNYEDRIQVIFRRSPVDLSGRYDDILKEYDNILVSIEPEWSNNEKRWTQLFPYYKDVNLLANICKHSDLVINVGSTMALDFAVFNNPAGYINYDAKYHENWSVNTIYRYQHFRSMPNKDVVYWINSKNDYCRIFELVFNNGDSKAKPWLSVINTSEIKSVNKISKLLIN